MTCWTQLVRLFKIILPESGAIQARPGWRFWDLLQIRADQIIWVLKKMSTFYNFYKSNKAEPGDE